jgi:single-stranded-DNA-specific exonuclease
MIAHSLPKSWVIGSKIPLDVDLLLQEYPPIFRQILYNRGYNSIEACRNFLEACMPEGIESFKMLGIPESVERVRWAIEQGQSIVVYGDYDADGVTATALLVRVLRSLGANADPYIPNRFDEGYGLNKEALENLFTQGKSLVITVDCGIRSLPEASYAKSIGIDLIISDHHQPASELPEAYAIINPKQPGDSYPYIDLAGVGLAYKLASALLSSYGISPEDRLGVDSYLDLVALGTVADLAPLTGENRALVRKGIEAIRRPQCQGIMSLIGVAGLRPNQINSSHIGFALGPRLNAAGRLESALAALNLLITTDVAEAARLAQQLEIQNRDRQQLTRQIQEQAEMIALEDDPNAILLFAAHPEFNPGVVGLAASRLCDLYYRPAIVAQLGEKFTRGSCRSIPEFHITQALDQCTDLMEHHGGHAAAAGFTVRNENLPELIRRLRDIANQKLGGLDLRPTLRADLEIPLDELEPDLQDLLPFLERLQPTGNGNPQVYFVSRSLKPTHPRAVGRENNHLRFSVKPGQFIHDAIAFQQGYWIEALPSSIDILYQFEVNEYNGRSSLQLNIRDIKPSGLPD